MGFAWATKRWHDAQTGTEVVRLSPSNTSLHYRNNYFRLGLFTADGRDMLMLSHEGLKAGEPSGMLRLWSLDLGSGATRDLGELPGSTMPPFWSTTRRSRLVHVIYECEQGLQAILAIDIDSPGNRRHIIPDKPLPTIYDGMTSADERYIYTPWWKQKWHLRSSMPRHEWVAMMTAEPGEQHMVRIDLESGATDVVFSTDEWFIAHPNPNPVRPNLLMCCQEGSGLPDAVRIRVIDLDTGQWFNVPQGPVRMGAHEHWAPTGRHIFAHGLRQHGIHFIERVDLDAGENRFFPCPPGVGDTSHVHIAPNEMFLVGDGRNFDRHSLPADLRQQFEKLIADPSYDSRWFERDLTRESGGETIWMYQLPQSTSDDWAKFLADRDSFRAALTEHPSWTVRTTPVCRFRTLCRSAMAGHILESNARVTPDNRWVVFQSSGENDLFEIWAARLPDPIDASS